ncbi:MAG TPA: hypothetical protein PKD49_06645 [Hyphomicrobium sp.]|nr:hypothetical protein [Hyphomicrobium sp.]
MPGALDQDRLAVALKAVRSWRARLEGVLSCPVCGVTGLVVTDCSSRPHAEWYRLQCAACGLEEVLNIPLGAGKPGGAQWND